jgi:PKD repeat protein
MAADGSNPTPLESGSSPSWRPTDTPLPPPNQGPIASFTYSCVRTKCTFDGRSSTDDKGIVSYAWNAGSTSGGNLSGAVVTHDYKRAGTYTAILTVRDAEGVSSSVSQIVTVTK